MSFSVAPSSTQEILPTKAFPHMLLVAHPRLSATEREKLTQALLGKDKTEPGKKIIRALGKSAHYIPYKSTDYDMIREYQQRWTKHAKNTL